MKVTNKNKKLLFQTKFPKKQLKTYFKKLKAKTNERLKKEEIEQIFIWAKRDFKRGKISLDEFADISDYLWTNHIRDQEKFRSKFSELLLATAELSYNIRFAHRGKTGKELLATLKKIWTYKPNHNS